MPKEDRECIECQGTYGPGNDRSSVAAWLKRRFCSNKCNQNFQRRIRFRKAHPQPVLDAMERMGIIDAPKSSAPQCFG